MRVALRLAAEADPRMQASGVLYRKRFLPRPCLCAALLMLGSLSLPAGAISTSPLLVLTRVVADVGVSVRILRLEGALPAEDLIQHPFPLHILVRETQVGTGYVLYDLSSGAVSGRSAALVEGLDPVSVEAILLEEAEASDAAVVSLARDRIEVRLPDSFPSGSAEVVLFALYRGVPIVSNSVLFEIETSL